MAEKCRGRAASPRAIFYEHKLKRIRDGTSPPSDCRISAPSCRTHRSAVRSGRNSADVVLCDVPYSGLGIIRKKPRNPVQESGRNPDFAGDSGENPCKLCTVCKEGAARSSTRPVPSCSGKTRDVVRAFLTETRSLKRFRGRIRSAERADGMVTLLPPVHNTDGFFIAKMHRKV